MFIYRDFITPSRMQWNASSRLYQRFDRVWGKTTIDGIEVYNQKLVYWSGSVRSDVPFKRLLNALGVQYETLKNQKYEGVEDVYFKLKPSKYTYEPKTKAAIVADLNAEFDIGDEFELYVHYTGESRRIVANHFTLKSGGNPTKITDYTIDKDAIRATLESDPMKYFANAELVSAGILVNQVEALKGLKLNPTRVSVRPAPVTVVEYDSDNVSILSTLALLDNESVFRNMGISSEMITVKRQESSYDQVVIYYEYSYKVKYRVIADATVSSYVVDQIDMLGQSISNSLAYKGGNVYALSNHVLDTKLKEAIVSMNNVENLALTYHGLLRVDACAAMKRKDFATMFGKIFGSGYTKKKTKWYEKALAIIIIVVAIVIGVLTGGAGAIASGSLVAIGTALGVAATVATVGMMMYAAAFPYATDGVKMIGRFAQIAGLGAMVTGVFAAIQQSWQAYVRESGREIAAKQAGGVVTDEVMQQAAQQANLGGYVKYLFNSLVNSATTQLQSMSDQFVSFFDKMIDPYSWSVPNLPTMNNVSGWLGNLDTGMKLYMKFFGDKPLDLTSAESEQATKEDGVEAYYASVSMLDEVDALHRLDFMIKNNNGGQMTENYLVKIT